MKTLALNCIRKAYIMTALEKILKRVERKLERWDHAGSRKWAEENASLSTEEFCRSIDSALYDLVQADMRELKKLAELKLSQLPVSLGGGGNYVLLNFLLRKFDLRIVVETGVAAGWSSSAILHAFRDNGRGTLFSSDFPYLRLEAPERYIGLLAIDAENSADWHLDVRGDKAALPEITKALGDTLIDLFHYDSDKSYSGRERALKVLAANLSESTIIIFDDIQDNFHFRDFCLRGKLDFQVLEFDGKYVGITGTRLHQASNPLH